MELLLNVVWLAIALGALVAAPRLPKRTRVALMCTVALLFPIISISDDIASSSATFDEVATIVVTILIAFVLIAVASVDRVSEPGYAIALSTPSDPRSPPRA